jgi:hypothetical protein
VRVVTRRRGGRLETAALVVLGFGWLLPGVGWAVGAVLAVVSKVWSVREKLVGLVGMFVIAMVGWGLPIAVQTHSSTSRIVLEALMFSGVFSALYLWRRLRLDRTDF